MSKVFTFDHLCPLLVRVLTQTTREYNPARDTSYDLNYIYSTVLKFLNNLSDRQSFEVGSLVEVFSFERLRYGVIRWIGPVSSVMGRVVAGLELVKTALSCLAPLIILLFTQKFLHF